MSIYTFAPQLVLAEITRPLQAHTAGGTLVAGNFVYRDEATHRVFAAHSATEAAAQVLGICLNGASLGQPVIVMESGLVTVPVTYPPAGLGPVGKLFVLSATPGRMMDFGDLETAYITLLGWSVGPNQLRLEINVTGLVSPAS